MLDLYSPYRAIGRYEWGWRDRVYRRNLTRVQNAAVVTETQVLLAPDEHDFLVLTRVMVRWTPGPTASIRQDSNIGIISPPSAEFYVLLSPQPHLGNTTPATGEAVNGVADGPILVFPGESFSVNGSYGIADGQNAVFATLFGYRASLETLR